MPTMTILARAGEFDIEIAGIQFDEPSQIAGIVALFMAEGIQPRPRFQGNKPQVAMPFVGVIESTEDVPAKDGKRPYCLAHVKHDDGSIVDVRYFPPRKTWQAGEKVVVEKGQYGPQLAEMPDNGEPPF